MSRDKFEGLNLAYEQVKAFHMAFGHPVGKEVQALDDKRAVDRACWTAEEIVEFLYATAEGDRDKFRGMVTNLLTAVVTTEGKILEKGEPVPNKVVAQADALTDINYFTQGSYVEMGVEPQPLFDIVQDANMAKLWEDGKPRYRETDGKIMKPEGWVAPEPLLEKEIERQIKKSSK